MGNSVSVCCLPAKFGGIFSGNDRKANVACLFCRLYFDNLQMGGGNNLRCISSFRQDQFMLNYETLQFEQLVPFKSGIIYRISVKVNQLLSKNRLSSVEEGWHEFHKLNRI